MHRRYNDKLTISNYLPIDILHGAYRFGDSIFSLELAFKKISLLPYISLITSDMPE